MPKAALRLASLLHDCNYTLCQAAFICGAAEESGKITVAVVQPLQHRIAIQWARPVPNLVILTGWWFVGTMTHSGPSPTAVQQRRSAGGARHTVR